MTRAKLLVQTSECAGTYRNPYKRGGLGTRWDPWRTVARFDTLTEAQAELAKLVIGLARKRVVWRGKVLIDDQGRTWNGVLVEFSLAQEQDGAQ